MMTYSIAKTACLVVDPLNDFLSPFGKAWPMLRQVTRETRLQEKMGQTLRLVRSRGIQVVFAPHERYRGGKRPDRKYLHPSQYLQGVFRMFSARGFGGRFHKDFRPKDGDIIASEHACSSGFIGTDLQDLLQERGITHLIIVGMLANTCIESTARSAVDLGYHVTLMPECVATWTHADQAAAVDHSYKQLGHQILSLGELEAALEEREPAHA
ncbi:cysteine hydrolase family protein [Roseibium sp. RKSG952]|uniref:cysteine hydrolase family protein n=1 Tax=Roseibium sp. RKSG952 TaxID=2529384 RepID=UPI0012BB678B|nr:isochorismatase family cysteine hydrolase [Roseibium sp. RKSG952]MTH95273.1 cysteine hydrolase [Roseibium sp. RKSG952]